MSLPLLAFVALLSTGGDPLADIGTKYNVTIDVRQEAFTIHAKGYVIGGATATKEAMDKYVPLWTKEWQMYPPSLMAKAKVTRIVFCEALSIDSQVRAAVPAFDLNAMYYDPKLGNYNALYQRSVIHHEFFHMIDQRMGHLRVDPEWSALNAKDFKYGTGGDKMRTSGVGNLTADIPGFLTLYGTSAVEEDKAELYAHLIVSTKFVTERAEQDPVLASKIALLKKRLAEFDPGMGTSFWPKSLGAPSSQTTKLKSDPPSSAR